MANKKQTPSEDWFFLPQRVQESTKLDITEKNVVAALCNCYYTFNDYALEHNGWFYVTQKELEEETSLSHKQLNRILNKLQLKTIVERKSGSTNNPTHYRLHPEIVKLMPKLPKFDNDTYVSLYKDIKVVETPKTVEKIANDTQDKIREDKKRQEESFLITSLSNSIESNNNVVESGKTKEDFSIQQQFNSREFYYKWSEVFKACKSEEEIIENFNQAAFTLPNDFKKDAYTEALQDEYSRLRAHLHWKKSK